MSDVIALNGHGVIRCPRPIALPLYRLVTAWWAGRHSSGDGVGPPWRFGYAPRKVCGESVL